MKPATRPLMQALLLNLPKPAACEHAPVAADDDRFNLARLSGEDTAAAVAHAPSATSAGKSKPAA